jgi:hypothetical protein
LARQASSTASQTDIGSATCLDEDLLDRRIVQLATDAAGAKQNNVLRLYPRLSPACAITTRSPCITVAPMRRISSLTCDAGARLKGEIQLAKLITHPNACRERRRPHPPVRGSPEAVCRHRPAGILCSCNPTKTP